MGQFRESDGHDSFQYFGDCFKENYYTEGRRCVLRGLAWFVQDHSICVFEAGRVVAESHKGREHVEENGGFCDIHFLPDLIGYAVRSRGRGGGAPA